MMNFETDCPACGSDLNDAVQHAKVCLLGESQLASETIADHPYKKDTDQSFYGKIHDTEHTDCGS